MAKKNCRFCEKMTDWAVNEKEHMVHFDCSYWEKKYGKSQYPIWVWPDMEFNCDEYTYAGATAMRVLELEQALEENARETEKLRKALSQG
jgi:hypothetical protein